MSIDAQATNPAAALPRSPSDPAYIRAERLASTIEQAFVGVWTFARFVLFVLYLAVGILAFWLWVVSFALGVVRLGLRMVMASLLFLSGGIAPRFPGASPNLVVSLDREIKYLWNTRLVAYENVARPVARHWVKSQEATRTFWHWGIGRKATALLLALFFIGIPMTFVIPRPQYVQITDDNAVHYDQENNNARVSYLVHATDLGDRGKTREYRNEDMWWLGKINSQGLKSQLQPGNYYKLWIVGIRWYYMPRLFPNIISATEIDANRNPITDPSRLLRAQPGTQAVPQ